MTRINHSLVSVKEMTVIEVAHTNGSGARMGDPVRLIKSYYAKNGELLAVYDEYAQTNEGEEQI